MATMVGRERCMVSSGDERIMVVVLSSWIWAEKKAMND